MDFLDIFISEENLMLRLFSVFKMLMCVSSCVLLLEKIGIILFIVVIYLFMLEVLICLINFISLLFKN